MVPVFTVLTEPVRVLCQQGSPWDRLIEALDWTLEHLGLDGHGDGQRRHRRLDALMGNIYDGTISDLFSLYHHHHHHRFLGWHGKTKI